MKLTKRIAAIAACAVMATSSMVGTAAYAETTDNLSITTMSLEEFQQSRLSSEYVGIYYDEYDNEAFINNTGDSLILYKVYASNGRFIRGQADSGWHITSGEASLAGTTGMRCTVSNGYYLYQNQWNNLDNPAVVTGTVYLENYGHYQIATIEIHATAADGQDVVIQKFVQQKN